MSNAILAAQTAVTEVLASRAPEFATADPLVRPSAFADAQSNVALALARRLGRDQIEFAAELAADLENYPEFASVTVSGPGFLNFIVADQWVAKSITDLGARDSLVSHAAASELFVVDYSSPNVAKEMHVGHLRTTVVGDALTRLLEAKGHEVVRQNHIGDWGTPFGMLIELLNEVGTESETAQTLISDPNSFYQNARQRFENDAEFTERARLRVVKL